MSTKYPLNETLSPIDRERRMQLNENWQRITSYFEHVQSQIKILAGGKDLDDVITRLEDAIKKANIDVENYILQLDQTVQQAIENNDIATQDAIDANNTATQNAINANNANLQAALQSVTDALALVDTAISDATTATQDATDAKDATIQATNDAQNAINEMNLLINNFTPRGLFASGTQYYKNNIVRDEEGNSYIARDNNTNVGLADTTKWMLFAAKGDKGDKGDKGEQGTGLNILGSLTDISQLPVAGNPGDAYTVNGSLYIWSENTESWEDNGNIKGEKGDKGDTGEDGRTAYEVAVANGFIGTEAEWLASLKGDTPDLTEIEQSISDVRLKITNHLKDSAANVKDFGAVGDGIADDTEAIQTALYSGRKMIFIPPGTYLISNTLRVQANVTLMGSGIATVFKAANLSPGKQLLMNQNVIGDTNVYIDKNIVIDSICFDGANLPGRTFEFLFFGKVEGLSLKNCYFQNVRGMCLGAAGSKDIVVDNCTFRNNGHPRPSTISSPCVWMDKQGEDLIKNATIINCTFESNNWSGCYFMPENGKIINSNFINNGESSVFVNANGKGIIIENNYIKGARRSNISGSGIELESSDTIVRGNIIELCDSDGISVTNSENVIITDNIIRNNGQDSTYFTTASGVSVISNGTLTPRNIKLSNNRISDNQTIKKQKYGICIAGTGGAMRFVEIIDNNLNDYAEGAIYIADGKFGEGCYTANNSGHSSQKPVIGRFQAPSAPGNFSVTNIGFKPRYITFFTLEPSGSAIYNSNGETNGNESKCSYYSSNGGTSVASVVDGKVVMLKGTDGAERCTASLVSLDQKGFTLNFTSTTTRPYITFVAHP